MVNDLSGVLKCYKLAFVPNTLKKPGYFFSRPQGINYNGNCSNYYCYILLRLAEILLLPKFLVSPETVVLLCFDQG